MRPKKTTRKKLLRMELEEVIMCAEFFMVVSSKIIDLIKYIQAYDQEHFEEHRDFLERMLKELLNIPEHALYLIEDSEVVRNLKIIHPLNYP
jgi:hypothetical protein